MPKNYLIPHEGNFYKASLHSHCTKSDGRMTPEGAKERYKKNGYSIYAYTDHNTLNYFKDLNDPEFLVLCGYELDVTTDGSLDGFPKTCHINAISRNPENAVYIPKPAKYDIPEINKTIQKLRDANYIVNYNHPGWSSQEASDYLDLKGFTAMEIYNHGCEVTSNDGDARLHYDIMLKHGMQLFCIATDDNHSFDITDKNIGDDTCGGWTMIKAPALDYGSVIKAFDNGWFYSSTGPEIYDYYIENDKICIDCSPVTNVFVKTNCIGIAGVICDPDGKITHYEFSIENHKKYVPFIRFEIKDANGKMAFTNPYFFK